MPWKELNTPSDKEERALDLQYRGKARFIVDESAGVEVARILQRFGYNAKFVGEFGLCGHSDEARLGIAASSFACIAGVHTGQPDLCEWAPFHSAALPAGARGACTLHGGCFK